MTNEKKFNKWFSVFILVGMTVALITTTVLKTVDKGSLDALLLISAVGSLMGVLASVASANGMIVTFLFGLIDVSIYTFVCLISKNYGNFAMHLLYLIPMQFYGLHQWRKRGASGNKEVKARRLTKKGMWLWLTVSIASSLVSYVVLLYIAKDKDAATTFLEASIIADAVSMICNIVGQFLMSSAYMEQWYFWITVNVASIIMWSVKLGSGEDFALIYIIKYSFYLINSLNGLRIWLKLSREQG